jgi:hypothetical protein
MSFSPLPKELESLVEAARSDLPDAPFVARLENAVVSSAVARAGRRRLSWRSRHAMLAAAAVILFAVAGPAAVLWWRARAHGTPPPPAVPMLAAPVAPAPVSALEGAAAEERPREPEAAVLVAPVKRRALAPASRQPAATEAEPVVLPEPEVSGPSELALMKQAQALTGTNPTQALALCAEHQQRFARGVLAEEREAIAVEALLRLGQKTEAQARARRFLRDHPGSAYRARMQTALDAGAH